MHHKLCSSLYGIVTKKKMCYLWTVGLKISRIGFLFKACNETNKKKKELVVFNEMPFNIVK